MLIELVEESLINVCSAHVVEDANSVVVALQVLISHPVTSLIKTGSCFIYVIFRG